MSELDATLLENGNETLKHSNQKDHIVIPLQNEDPFLVDTSLHEDAFAKRDSQGTQNAEDG